MSGDNKHGADKAALTADTFYFYCVFVISLDIGMTLIKGNIQASSINAETVSEQSRLNQTPLYSAWCPSSSRESLWLVDSGCCTNVLLNQYSCCQLYGWILHGRWHGTDALTSHNAVKCLQSALFQHTATNLKCWAQRPTWLTAICSLLNKTSKKHIRITKRSWINFWLAYWDYQ